MSYKFAGYFLESFQDQYGHVLISPSTASVFLTGTQTLATLYTDSSKTTTTPNPFTIPASGNVGIWADPGFYDVVPVFEGITLPLITIQVPLNPLEIVPPADQLAVFNMPGTLAVKVGQGAYPFPYAGVIVSVMAQAGTAPTGAPIIVDVLKNGVSVWNVNPGNRPSIAIGATQSGIAVPDVTSFAAKDYLTVNVVQVGSTIAGADLDVTVRYQGSVGASSQLDPAAGTTLDAIPQPLHDLNMAGHKIINLAPGVASTDAATVGQLSLGQAMDGGSP